MLAWADLPDVQIQHADIVAQRLGNRLRHPGRRRIQQHIRRAVQQATAPPHNHHRPHQPHDRIQPAPAITLAQQERHNRQHRGQGIGQHMQISRAQIVVVVIVMMMAGMVVAMVVAVMMMGVIVA